MTKVSKKNDINFNKALYRNFAGSHCFSGGSSSFEIMHIYHTSGNTNVVNKAIKETIKIKKMKRIITILIVSLLSLNGIIVQAFEVDGIEYSITSATEPYEVEVISKTPEYTGEITLPESIMYLGNTYAVTSIGVRAFYFCEDLLSISISNSITTIGVQAFAYCSSLESVQFSNSLATIEHQAFQNCTGLTYVELSSSAITIDYHSFMNCTGLTSVDIPSSVSTIGHGAFMGCSNLESINVETNNQYFSSIDGVLYNKDVSVLVHFPPGRNNIDIPNTVTEIQVDAFSSCHGLTSISLPNSINIISESAFFCCTGLTTIAIPNSVTNIGTYAFFGCSGLTSVKSHAITPPELGAHAFDWPTDTPLYVPTESIDAYKNAYGWK